MNFTKAKEAKFIYYGCFYATQIKHLNNKKLENNRTQQKMQTIFLSLKV